MNGGSIVWGFCVYVVYMIPLETDPIALSLSEIIFGQKEGTTILVNVVFLLRLSICTRRWFIDKLVIFDANQTSICLDPHHN